MIQALQPPITFDEFVEWLPETSEYRYELHRGVIVEMPKPRGKHSKVSGNLAYDLGTAIRQANWEHVSFASGRTALIPQPLLPQGEGEQDFKVPLPVGEGFRVRADKVDLLPANLPYFIPKECIVRSMDGNSAYEPDVIVLDESVLIDEPDWESSSIITLGKSIQIIVEVVSTNWRDDYFTKFGEYEALGIQEYWIVDYAALGGRRFIGNPKQPTFTLCQLVDGEYQLQQFRAGDRLLSATFPNLALTVDQVFAAG